MIKENKRITINEIARRCRRRRRLKGIHSRPDTNRTGAEGLSFYYPRLLHCLDQMLAVMSLSQHRVSIAESLGVSAGSAAKIIDSLGYSKECAMWVSKQLAEAHKQSRLEACSELLEYCHSGKTFMQQIVTGDEIWIHHFEPESKTPSMEWHHPTSPRSKKFKSEQSAGKVIVNVFWDSVGVILVDFMSKGTTINSDVYSIH